MAGADAARLRAMAEAAAFVWVLGNHDPAPARRPAWRGRRRNGTMDGIVFRHEAHAAAPDPGLGELCGHHHPKASHRDARGAGHAALLRRSTRIG